MIRRAPAITPPSRVLARLPVFGPVASSRPGRRLLVLDGLRGWAALGVVCSHVFWETFGVVEPAFRNLLTASLLDGSLAVGVFFVLSGEALSASYFAGRGPRAVVELAVKRYPRLVIPVMAAAALTTLLAAMGLCRNQAAAAILDRSDWLGAFLTTPVGFGRLLRFSLVDVFTKVDPRDSLMPFLWSMRIELAGSILIFAALLACHRRRAGWLLFGLLLFAALAAYAAGIQTAGNLACFLVGSILARLRASQTFDHLQQSRRLGWASAALILVVLAGDAVLHATDTATWRAPAMAMILVPLLACNGHVERFLSNGVSRVLGHLSFPLFLVQFPVLVSFTSMIVAHVGRECATRFSLAIAVASVAVSLTVAALFSPVELFTKAACNALVGFLPWRVQQTRP